MKLKDYLWLVVIVVLAIWILVLNDKQTASDLLLKQKDLQLKENLYKIDSLHYEYNCLELEQDSLHKIYQSDSLLLIEKQKGINYLYNKLKKQNEEIDNSSGADDYEYLLNISK